MGINLTNLYIDETFPKLVQTSGSVFTDGTGSLLTEVDITASNSVSSSYALTASYALNSIPQVSSSYAVSASHALNADNAISSSHALVADLALTASYMIAEDVTFDDTNFAYTASNVQIALQRLSDNKADISQLTSNVTTFPTTASADVGGYFALVTSSVDARYNQTHVDVPTGPITGTGQLISSLITDGALFTGNPGIVNLSTAGQIRRVGGSGEANFYYEVYTRSGSTETLIATSDNSQQVDSNVYEEFNASAVLNNGTFTSDDRIVLKFYANRIGGGSTPSYEFMFGGTTPVRTIFPVPATVLVSPWNGLFTGDAIISGTLNVTEGITGSLQGNADTATSASYALTASYALNAGGGAGFPFTGSAGISGSLRVHNNNGLDAQFKEDGSISLEGSNTIEAVVGGTTFNLSQGSNTLSKPDSGSLTTSLNNFGGNTAVITNYTADSTFVNASGGLIYSSNNFMQFTSNNEGVAFNSPTQIDFNALVFNTPVDINLNGSAFLYTAASNINGFSFQVNQLSVVKSNQRAFVETPLVVGSSGTVEVSIGSVLKVINEL